MPTPSLKSGEHLQRFSVPLETVHIVSVCVNWWHSSKAIEDFN